MNWRQLAWLLGAVAVVGLLGLVGRRPPDRLELVLRQQTWFRVVVENGELLYQTEGAPARVRRLPADEAAALTRQLKSSGIFELPSVTSTLPETVDSTLSWTMEGRRGQLHWYNLPKPYRSVAKAMLNCAEVASGLEWLDRHRQLAPLPPGMPPGDGCRQEIVLERAPSWKVMALIRWTYPHLILTQHPTRNGFLVYGTKSELLPMKADVANNF